jgi:ketosteroid isomerase-like protein
MSQENVEVVKRFETMMVPSLQEEDEATAQGGFEQILELLDENVAFRPTPSLPHGGDWIGHDGFFKLGEAFIAAWELPTGVEFEYLDGGGDKVVILARFDSVSRHTGKTVEFKMVEIVTVRDGKITELVPYYYDTIPIVEAAGLLETA